MGFAVGPLLLASITGTAGDLPFYLGAGAFRRRGPPAGLHTPATRRGSRRAAPRMCSPSCARRLAPTLAASAARGDRGRWPRPPAGLRPARGPRRQARARCSPASSSSATARCSCRSALLPTGSRRQAPAPASRSRRPVGVGALVLALMGTTSPLAFEALLLLWGGLVGALSIRSASVCSARSIGAPTSPAPMPPS